MIALAVDIVLLVLAPAGLLAFALCRVADIPTPKMTLRVDRVSFDYRLRALAATVRDD